jgi:hypothetical protein
MNVSKVKILVAVVVASLGVGATLIGSTRVLASPTCLLEVDGQRYIDGACDGARDKLGGMLIGNSASTAIVRTRPGDSDRGSGIWRGDASGHVKNLGPLSRDGTSCWRNARTRICVWGGQ